MAKKKDSGYRSDIALDDISFRPGSCSSSQTVTKRAGEVVYAFLNFRYKLINSSTKRNTKQRNNKCLVLMIAWQKKRP